MRVQSLGGEDALEEDMAAHSIILAWRIPWTEEPGGLWSVGSQKNRAQVKRLSTHTQLVNIHSPPNSLPSRLPHNIEQKEPFFTDFFFTLKIIFFPAEWEKPLNICNSEK